MSAYQPLGGKGNEYLFFRPPSQNIYVRRKKKGFPSLFASLGTSNVSLARIRRDEKIALWLGVKPTKKTLRKLTDEVFHEMIEQKAQIGKTSSINTLKYSWKRLQPDFGLLFIDEISSSTWESWVASQKRENPTLKMFSFHKVLNMVLNFAVRERYREGKPYLYLKDDQATVAEIFTDKELDQCIERAQMPFQLFLKLIRLTGIRPGELEKLPKDRINHDKKCLALKAEDSKINRAREIPLMDLYDDLVAWTLSNESRFIFPSPKDPSKPSNKDTFRRQWDSIRAELGISKRRYDIRHTAATKMATRGIPATMAAKILGHDIKTYFKTYLKPTAGDLEKEMKKLLGEES